LEGQMRAAAKSFEFERAAALRDRIRGLKQRDLDIIGTTNVSEESESPPSGGSARSATKT
jgi:hypothetical protein